MGFEDVMACFLFAPGLVLPLPIGRNRLPAVRDALEAPAASAMAQANSVGTSSTSSPGEVEEIPLGDSRRVFGHQVDGRNDVCDRRRPEAVNVLIRLDA